jgi:hypothetical protein
MYSLAVPLPQVTQPMAGVRQWPFEILRRIRNTAPSAIQIAFAVIWIQVHITQTSPPNSVDEWITAAPKRALLLTEQRALCRVCNATLHECLTARAGRHRMRCAERYQLACAVLILSAMRSTAE